MKLILTLLSIASFFLWCNNFYRVDAFSTINEHRVKRQAEEDHNEGDQKIAASAENKDEATEQKEAKKANDAADDEKEIHAAVNPVFSNEKAEKGAKKSSKNEDEAKEKASATNKAETEEVPHKSKPKKATLKTLAGEAKTEKKDEVVESTNVSDQDEEDDEASESSEKQNDESEDAEKEEKSPSKKEQKKAVKTLLRTTILRCQDSATGELLPAASACTDKLPGDECAKRFPKNGTAIRPDQCNLRALQTDAYECAHTCKICCEIGHSISTGECRDNYEYDCESELENCQKTEEHERLYANCRQTCGYCQKFGRAVECRDMADGCITNKGQCESDVESVAQFMQAKCSETCGLCQNTNASTPTACENESNDCDVLRCHDSNWRHIMRETCAQMCRTCDLKKRIELKRSIVVAAGGDPDCFDLNDECPKWVAKGFCRLDQYSAVFKLDNCEASCGYCKAKTA